MTLTFNNITIGVSVPTLTIPGTSLSFWIANDGSIYYARSDHGFGGPNQDAWYAMQYDSGGLAAASYSALGNSPCVQSGDTTIRAYGEYPDWWE